MSQEPSLNGAQKSEEIPATLNKMDHNIKKMQVNLNQMDSNTASPKKEISLLFIGETGAGKSTAINATINAIYSIPFEEEHLVLIPTEGRKSSFPRYEQYFSESKEEVAKSQTRKAVTYTVTVGDTKYNLTDTPGLNDTKKESEKFSQDLINVDLILKEISERGHFNCIVWVINGGNTRYGEPMKQLALGIQKLLTKESAKKICFLVTRTIVEGDEKPPAVIVDIIKNKLNFPHAQIFYAEFRALYSSSKSSLMMGAIWNVSISIINLLIKHGDDSGMFETTEYKKLEKNRQQLKVRFRKVLEKCEQHLFLANSWHLKRTETTKVQTMKQQSSNYYLDTLELHGYETVCAWTCEYCTWPCSQEAYWPGNAKQVAKIALYGITVGISALIIENTACGVSTCHHRKWHHTFHNVERPIYQTVSKLNENLKKIYDSTLTVEEKCIEEQIVIQHNLIQNAADAYSAAHQITEIKKNLDAIAYVPWDIGREIADFKIAAEAMISKRNVNDESLVGQLNVFVKQMYNRMLGV